MNDFTNDLKRKLLAARYNSFGADNYDEYRFGELTKISTHDKGDSVSIKKVIKRFLGYKNSKYLSAHEAFFNKYGQKFESFYRDLNEVGQKLLIEIIAYRLLGYEKVKLSRNNREYNEAIDTVKSLVSGTESIDPGFLHYTFNKYDLKKIGFNVQLYLSEQSIAIDFILEQYLYKKLNNSSIGVREGDIVLDIGACWGDTALYFAEKTGKNGKVFSFEFIPDSIHLFNLNVSLNPDLKSRIELIQHPVSDRSGEKIYFKSNGPGSRIEFEAFIGQTGFAETISIDDFVKDNNVTHIDFIKMDIEGAESLALKGATETIKRFQPKLAVAIYHDLDDFINIPNWISGLNLGYKFYLGHYTIHSEETILFAESEK